MFQKILTSALLVTGLAVRLFAQKFPHDGRLYLGNDSTRYFKFTLNNQLWLRRTQANPGSTVNGFDKSQITDIGIRRMRIQAYGQLTDRVFIYTQFGINNFNYLSARKAGFFVHDAIGEYAFVKTRLSLGMGLSAWSGLSRYSSPAVGTIMGVDAPLFEQSTNDVTDQFLRKLSVYAKGKLGKFDYRLVMSNPLAFQTETAPNTVAVVKVPAGTANFSPKPPRMQWNGYFQWQFFDHESNLTPYMAGTYLGTKRVFNIGAGFVYQPEAMLHTTLGSASGRTVDSVFTAMRQLAVDVYYDAPIGTKGSALHAYAAFSNFDFGPNYVRDNGPMNPANGNKLPTVLNGPGNGFPLVGTGNVFYVQVGYKLRNGLLGTYGTLMPYASVQHADFELLNDPGNYYDAGVNWLLAGHTSKLTLAYQSRPVYVSTALSPTDYRLTEHRGSLVLQYQAYFN